MAFVEPHFSVWRCCAFFFLLLFLSPSLSQFFPEKPICHIVTSAIGCIPHENGEGQLSLKKSCMLQILKRENLFKSSIIQLSGNGGSLQQRGGCSCWCQRMSEPGYPHSTGQGGARPELAGDAELLKWYGGKCFIPSAAGRG